MKKRHTAHIIKYTAVALAFAMVVSMAPTGYVHADEKTAANQQRWAPEKFRSYGITYKDFCIKNGEPAPGHILIGTYLINLVPEDPGTDAQGNPRDFEPAITGEVYQAAMVSRKTYSQDVSFYKSELASGEWRDIDIATSIAYLLPTGGVAVSEEEMDNMLITVYVSGGKEKHTTDDDDSDENPFLKPSPYNLDDMQAMKKLLAMTTDGTLKYRTDAIPKEQVAENQSKRFMYDRIIYMFGHDMMPETLPLMEGDGQKAKDLNAILSSAAGSKDNKLIEKHNDYVEKNAELDFDMVKKAVDGTYYTDGTEGTIASSARLLFHFSDTRDEITDPLDDAVVNLWNIYLEYKKLGDSASNIGVTNEDKTKFLYALCASCDTARRAEAYYNLSLNADFHEGTGPVLYSLRDMATNGTSNIGRNIANMEYYESESKALTSDKTTGGFAKDDNLTQAINLAIKDANDMYSDYSAYALTRGVTALSVMIYDDKMKLIEKEKKDDETDKLLTEAILAEAIKNDHGIDDAQEASLLTTKLIPTQNTILSAYLMQGLPSKYNQLGNTAAQNSALLASQQSTALASEAAMESLINSYLKREMTESAYAPVLQDQLIWVKGQKSKIKNTAYAKYAEEVRQKYEDFLKKTMQDLGLSTGEEDGDPLMAALEKEKEKAEKNNDPKTAKMIDSLIDKYQREKPNTPAGYVPKINIDPESGVPSVSYEPKGSTTDGLAGMFVGAEGTGKVGDGKGGNGEDTSGTQNASQFDLTSVDGLLAALENALGQSFDSMSPDGKVALIAALNQYGREQQNQVALQLARKLLDQIMQENNTFVFTQFAGSIDMEYVSLAAIDKSRVYTRYRLVEQGLDITMTRTDVGYSYTHQYGNATVTDMDNNEKDLTARLASRTDDYMGRGATERYPYLDEVDSQVNLDCRAEYIVDTRYALVITATMEDQIKNILGILSDLYKK